MNELVEKICDEVCYFQNEEGLYYDKDIASVLRVIELVRANLQSETSKSEFIRLATLRSHCKLVKIQELADKQGADKELWFVPMTERATRLQDALRELHKVIEGE